MKLIYGENKQLFYKNNVENKFTLKQVSQNVSDLLGNNISEEDKKIQLKILQNRLFETTQKSNEILLQHNSLEKIWQDCTNYFQSIGFILSCSQQRGFLTLEIFDIDKKNILVKNSYSDENIFNFESGNYLFGLFTEDKMITDSEELKNCFQKLVYKASMINI